MHIHKKDQGIKLNNQCLYFAAGHVTECYRTGRCWVSGNFTLDSPQILQSLSEYFFSPGSLLTVSNKTFDGTVIMTQYLGCIPQTFGYF